MLLRRLWAGIWRSNKGRLILALGAGLVFPFAFAPFDLWPLALFALVVLHQAIEHARGRWEIVGIFFLFAIGKFGAGAYWIFVSLVSFSEATLFLAIGLFVAFLLVASALFSLSAFFAAKSPSPTLNALLFAAGLTVIEILFALPWALSFPWLYIGYAFIDTPVSIFAPYGGVWAVSFVVALSAAAIGNALNGQWRAIVVAVVLWSPGLTLSEGHLDEGESVSVALVQGNVRIEDKWKNQGWQESLSKYIWLSGFAPHTDLVVWPESAVPVDVNPMEEEIIDTLGEFDGRLVFGALESRKVEHRSVTHNVVVAFDRSSLSFYRKERLVPFGEYIPMRNVLGGVLRPLGYPMSSLAPATSEQAPLRLGNLTLGSIICYEIAYPHLVRRRASQTDLIVVLSEDSWLGDTSGPWQHLQIARMRALELNRPLVRATNDGLTASIDGRGSIVKQLPQFRDDVLVDSVVLQEGSTLYAKFGVLPVALLIVLVLLTRIFAQRSASFGDR